MDGETTAVYGQIRCWCLYV